MFLKNVFFWFSKLARDPAPFSARLAQEENTLAIAMNANTFFIYKSIGTKINVVGKQEAPGGE